MLRAVTVCCAVAAVCAFATPGAKAEERKLAFLHEPHAHTMSHYSRGCFVTLSPTEHTRGIRHWRNPCPHHHRKDMNPHHRGYHRLYPHH
ncbi:MAG: hypothetical protein N2444_09375 [Methylocystis sp.]|nr:hypothetical protein [Methylocystis sp.]